MKFTKNNYRIKTKLMNELIKITEENGQRAVSARELHLFLEVQSKFADWIKNRINEYGFVEEQDYITLSKNLENGGRFIEYALTLDMAKELFELIRDNLLKGDMVAVAKENNFNFNTVKSVMYYSNYSPEIVKALYKKALSNKNQLRNELETMVQELKQ